MREHPQPLATLLDALDRVVVPATLHWQHPAFFGYFPGQRLPHLAARRPALRWPGQPGDAWSTAPAGTEVEQYCSTASPTRSGSTRGSPSGGGGGTIARLRLLRRTRRPARRPAPQLRPAAGATTGSTAVNASTSPPKPTPRSPKPPGWPGWVRAALLVVDPTPGTVTMSPDALAAVLRADPPPDYAPSWSARPSAPPAPARSTPSAPSPPSPAPTTPGYTSTPPGPGSPRCAPSTAPCSTASNSSTRSAPTPTNGCSPPSTPRCLGTRHHRPTRCALHHPRVPAQHSHRIRRRHRLPRLASPLGRRFRALKLSAVLHSHGLEGLRAHIRTHITLATELAHRVTAEPGFTLAAPPSLALTCLRCDTGHHDTDDKTTRALLDAINTSGQAFLDHTVINGRYTIRVAIGGVTTTREHIDALWSQLRDTAGRPAAATVAYRRARWPRSTSSRWPTSTITSSRC